MFRYVVFNNSYAVHRNRTIRHPVLPDRTFKWRVRMADHAASSRLDN